MKKVIFTLGTLAISVGLFAQIAPISDVKKTMSKGENTGLEVLINKATSSDIAKVFEAKTKDFKGKFIKPEKGNVEYFIDDAKIASISDQPVDIYAYFLQEGENVRFTSFYSVGGLYFSPANAPQYASAKGIVESVYKQVLFDQFDAKIKDETKKQSGMEGDLKGLEKDKDGLQKDIKKSNDVIGKSEGEISQGEKDKANNATTVETQKAAVAKQKEELAKFDRKALETEINALENDKKGVEKDMEKASKEIGAKTAEIEKLKNEISTLNTQVESNKKAIDEKTKLIAEKQGTINNNNLEEKEKALKEAQKQQEKLEKDGEKIVKEIEKNKSTIADNKSKINTAEAGIKDNDTKQAAKKAELDAQKEVVNKLKEEQAKYK